MQERQSIPLPWPLRGVDQGLPVALQPPLTCPDARNVRSFSASSKRLGGGRRAGLTKANSAQFCGGSRIVHGRAITRIPNTTAPSTEGTFSAVLQSWAGYQDAIQDLGGEYLVGRRVASNGYVVSSAASGKTVSSVFSSGHLNLEITPQTSAANGETIVAINYATDNDIEVTLLCNRQATSAATAYQCTQVGPFIRGSALLDTLICAYLEFTGQPNTVRLVIDQLSASGVTRLKTSQRQFVLSGLNDVASFNSKPTIRLRATTTEVVASVNWPDAAPGGVVDELKLVSGTDAGATTYSDQTRGGVITRIIGAAALRLVYEMRYQKRIPYPRPIIGECLAPTVPVPGSGNAFRLPAGFAASGSLIGTVAPAITTGDSDTAANQVFPQADTTNDYIQSTTGNALNTRKTVMSWNADPTGGAQWGIEIAFRDIAATTDQINPCFLLGSDHNLMLRVEIERQIDATAQSTGQSFLTAFRIRAINTAAAPVITDIVVTTTFNNAIMFHTSQFMRVRISQAGTALAAIIIEINGVVVLTQNYGGVAAWTGLGANQPSGSRFGVDCAAQGAQSLSAGWRVVDMSAPSFTAVNPGTDIVAFSSSRVDVGELGGASAATCSGGGLTGSYPQSGFMFNKLYAVDGLNSKVIDPILRTVEDWPQVSNTALDRCYLACVYRNSMVIAKQRDKPGIWYMSRVGNAQDFNFGATDSGRAITGANADAGQPADEIMAMVTFSDDLMIFGCRGSTWIMQGDPRAGGRVDVLAPGVGWLSERAWCFDEEGNLYFMSPSGLMRIRRGQLGVEPLSGGRLPYLDEVDTDDTLVQMAFDTGRRAVMIYLTPKDGTTIGVHVCYDGVLESKNLTAALWYDDYPLAHGPWSVDAVQAPGDDDRRILLFGNDGYVRTYSEAVNTDDGTTIDAWIKFAPVTVAGGEEPLMCHRLSARLGTGSGAFTWAWRVDESPNEVTAQALGTSRRTGTWGTTGGAQFPNGLSESGRAHQLLIRQNNTNAAFAIESVTAQIRPLAGAQTPGVG